MIRQLFEAQPLLMRTGVVSLLCLAALAGVALFDEREILGLDRWVKPMKFFASIAIYVWTLAVFLYFLPERKRAGRFIAWSTIVVFVVEMTIITGQAARGTTSHFNIKTPLDGMLFAIMGAAIAFNTLLAVYLLVLYFTTETALPRVVVWGIRGGLAIFLAACAQGAYMSTQLGHTVGAPDGGAGLPLLNWALTAGDLRVAHFVGMHALQTVPLVAWAAHRWRPAAAGALTGAFALAHFAVFALVFAQALGGRPLVPLG